jgi:hypothetical protein
MNAEQAGGRELRSAIRKILIADWDPIGVMDDPEWPKDEYDRYIGQLYSFLERGESADFIARHLCFVEEKEMGLGAVQPAARLEVAMKLKSLFAERP